MSPLRKLFGDLFPLPPMHERKDLSVWAEAWANAIRPKLQRRLDEPDTDNTDAEEAA